MGNACLKKVKNQPRVYSVSNGELASAVIGSTDISTIRSSKQPEIPVEEELNEESGVVLDGSVEEVAESVVVTTEISDEITEASTDSILVQIEDKMPVPDIQKPAPQFSGIAVVDGQFKNISLEDYKGKYVILFFYPLDFTFVCPTEIIAFSERADEFRQIGCELIACSTDSHFCHLAWVNTPRKQGGLGSLNIPLLADKACTISKSYGVYKEDEGLTFRGLFIIDDQQRLRQVTINDLPVGRSVDETLRLVQAFQFTDKHGEVCPAGWTPGKKSMKADPSGSKEYFESQH